MEASEEDSYGEESSQRFKLKFLLTSSVSLNA